MRSNRIGGTKTKDMKYTIEPMDPWKFEENGKIVSLNGFAFMDEYGKCIVIVYGERRRDAMKKYFDSDTNELKLKYYYVPIV